MNEKITNEEWKIVLLEWLAQSAIDKFDENGFKKLETYTTSFDWEELVEKLRDAEIVWIRSRTNLTKEILRQLPNLKAIWCFCIWTNQVDLDEARKLWINVFNAPFSNTRSVAELVIWEVIMLSRWIFEKSTNAHSGKWLKSANNSYEIKNKTLWVIGYWNIWKQVSVLAESMWMKVIFYDPAPVLWLWNASKQNNLDELLKKSDFVSLHVPDLSETRNLIGSKELDTMKQWSFLVNASRWQVVDIDALKKNLESKKILWAAIDVFPEEPKSKTEEFNSPLRWLDNVILTPHIGWSTIEAQDNIWLEVSEKLIEYQNNWTTIWSVNLPEVALKHAHDKIIRIIHIHENEPWILASITKTFSDNQINIVSQMLETKHNVWYAILDAEIEEISKKVLDELNSISWTIKTRILNS